MKTSPFSQPDGAELEYILLLLKLLSNSIHKIIINYFGSSFCQLNKAIRIKSYSEEPNIWVEEKLYQLCTIICIL